MTEFAVTIHDLEKSLDAKLIREGLIRYNQNFVDETAREITVIAKGTSGEIIGTDPTWSSATVES